MNTSKMATCDHDRLKSDPEHLRAATPAHGRPQLFDGIVEFYFRECPVCVSTIAIEPEVEMAARG